MPATGHIRLILLAAVLIGITCAVYWPGLTGGFLFDDEANIVNNTGIHIDTLSPERLYQAGLSGQAGPLKRPISMASFALTYYAFGLDPFYFKLVNLIIHVLTGASLGLLCYLLLGAPRLPEIAEPERRLAALAVAAAWLLHPFNLAVVLYAVQRMTSLAALFTVWGVIAYVYGRTRQLRGQPGWPFIVFGPLVFVTLGVLCKESSVLLFPYLLVTEAVLYGFRAGDHRQRYAIASFHALTVGVPVLAGAVFLLSSPEWFRHAYALREFDVDQRLLSEARIVMWYLRMIVIPDISSMGLHLDDVTASSSLLKPPTTLASVAAIIGLVALAWFVRHRLPVMSFGILWFFCGHLLESTILPLELAVEHRNYLPSFGVVFVPFYYLLAAPAPHRQWLRRGTAAVLVTVLGVLTAARASDWGDQQRFVFTELARHPDSPRGNYLAGWEYMRYAQNSPDPAERTRRAANAREYLLRAHALNPAMGHALVVALCMQLDFDRRLDRTLVAALKRTIRDHPVSAGFSASLALFTSCAGRHPDLLDTELYLDVMNRIVNKDSHPTQRSNTYLQVAAYYGTYIKDFDASARYAKLAAAAAPEQPGPYLALATWQIMGRHYDDALESVAAARARDERGGLQHDLDKLSSTIIFLQRNPDAAPVK